MKNKSGKWTANKERFSGLRDLLEACGDLSSPHWQYAWDRFFRKYDGFIRKNISEQCRTWNVSRLHLQFPETVKDITARVYLELCQNDCRAIRAFRGGDNEMIFRGWLKTICRRATAAHLNRYFRSQIVDTDITDLDCLKDYVSCLDRNERWQLFQAVVQVLRSSSGKKRKNHQRDINIFLLHVWADFTADMMSFHPLLKNPGHRVVDNVISRLRTQLRESRTRIHEISNR